MAKNIYDIGREFAEDHTRKRLADHWKNRFRDVQRQFAKDGDADAAVKSIVAVTASAGYHPNASDIRKLESMIK